MATVYSLVIWAGKNGFGPSTSRACTVSGATFTLTNHGLRSYTSAKPNSSTVQFVGGTLPGNAASGTTYYVKYLTANTFELYTNPDLATGKLTTSSGGSGWVLKSAYYVGLTDKSRWTYSGTEYIFDSLAAWRTHRYTTVPASAYDTEVCEIGMAWTEYISAAIVLNVPCAKCIVCTKVNDIRSDAFHNGGATSGYLLQSSVGYGFSIEMPRQRVTLDGIRLYLTAYYGYGILVSTGAYLCEVKNNIISGYPSVSDQVGMRQAGTTCLISRNIFHSFSGANSRGVYFADYGGTGSLICNNLAVKNTTGFTATLYTYGEYVGNVSVGNTTNWGVAPGMASAMSYNAGGATDTPWGANPVKTITADNSTFKDYANNDFTPSGDSSTHTSSSPLVDASIQLVGADLTDIIGHQVPAYKNGATEKWDLGPFEFDWGYEIPTVQTYTVTGATVGRIKIAKQSDGTEIYNGTALPNGETSTFSAATPVYIYLRKGSGAPYYHPLKLSATIDPDAGLTYDVTGLQQEDIAAHDYSATAVASDWTFNSGTGAIAHASGTTRYSVQDLYSWHQDYYDDAATIDDDPLMHGTTSTIFELINGGTITDADLEDLYGGSIEFGDGTLWSNLWTTDTMAAAHAVYVVQNGAKYSSFWSAGPIDVLLKVSNAGTLIDSGLVTVYARPYGYTYGQYTADLSAGGRTVAPILTAVDATCQAIDPSAFADVTATFGATSKDFGDGAGAQTYYCVIDCNNRPLSEVYARMMYLCRDVSTATLNGVEGWQYAKAHSSYTANTSAPFGNYVGGTWSVAKGVWLDNTRGLDYLDFILTDHAGGTHQNVSSDLATGLVSGLVAGSRIQIYNVTTATEMYNDIVSGTSYSTEYENGTGYTNGDVIRVRCAWMSGTSAKLPVQYTTVATIAGWSVLASQEDDDIYNANGIDGDTVTEFTADYPNVQIDIDDPDGSTTPQRGYAWYISGQMTADGIAYYHGAMTAEDAGNYRINVGINDMHIQNVSTSPVYITGARLYRSDGTRVTVAGSGPIEMEYGRVFTTTVTLSGESVVTGTAAEIIAAIPSTTANAAAVLAAAQVTPIQAECVGGSNSALTLPQFLALK